MELTNLPFSNFSLKTLHCNGMIFCNFEWNKKYFIEDQGDEKETVKIDYWNQIQPVSAEPSTKLEKTERLISYKSILLNKEEVKHYPKADDKEDQLMLKKRFCNFTATNNGM